MGTYGGFSPQPERYGGGKRRVEYIMDALLHADEHEVGLDVTPGLVGQQPSNVWIEEHATARAIDAAWSTNVRASNEFDPIRTQSMLPRWEKIFGIVPPLGATLPQRRQALKFAFQAFGKSPTPGQINDDLLQVSTTPDGAYTVFVQVVTTPSTTVGAQYAPNASSPTYGAFTSLYAIQPGPTLTQWIDWYSNTLHLAVQVARPAGLALRVFQDLVANVNSYLDGALPAWMTWSIFQTQGFFLDQRNFSYSAVDL